MTQRIKIALMALVFSAGLAGLAAANPLEAGMDAYQRGDYAAAMSLLRPLADNDDPAAKYTLGFMFQNGLGVTPDQVLAASFFHEAADLGYAPAMVNLGAMFETGAGIPVDKVEAHKWYSLAIKSLKTPADATARDAASANRKALAARMSESELADAREAAAAWRPK